MRRKNWELKGIFWIITLLFVGFLAAPILLLLGKSLVGEGGFTHARQNHRSRQR